MTKKDVFYQAALKLIHEKGFKAMTIRDLANELSCDSANIYNYTRSKLAILETLLFETSADFHQGIDRVLAAALDPALQMEEVIRLHVELSVQKPLRVGLLVNEWRNLKEPNLSQFVGERTSYENKVKKVIQGGVKKGVFRKLNVEVATASILGSLRWQHEYYLNHKKTLNSLDNLQELKRLILPGLLST